MKKICTVLTICLIVFLNLGAVFEIDAERNACLHNNLGINYLNDKDYYSAIKEFEIAIKLNPKTQATAVYYDNLGRTYQAIGYSKMAQTCFERCVIQNPMNFDYYLSLVSTYKAQGLLNSKLKEYATSKTNPLNQIMVGLIYVNRGQVSTGITVLDNFCNSEPDLVITKAVRAYIRNNCKK